MQGFGASTEKIPIYMIKEADYTQEERLKKKEIKVWRSQKLEDRDRNIEF